MVSQKQISAKRKTVIYLKIYLHVPKLIFLRQNRIDGSKIVSEYDQEIPQSQTADNAVAPRGKPAKLPEKWAAVKANLISSFLRSYIAQSSFYSHCINLPLHQPAPVSPICT